MFQENKNSKNAALELIREFYNKTKNPDAEIANKTIEENQGLRMIHVAVKDNRLDIIQSLLMFGVSIDSKSDRGMSPLHLAVRAGNRAIFDFLLDKNASLNMLDHNYNAPIHYAVLNTNSYMISRLLDNGVDVDTRGRRGDTPLHLASWVGNQTILDLLLSRNATVNIKNKYNNVPLNYALLNRNHLVVETLLAHGADVNAVGHNGDTPLYFSIAGKNETIINLILSRNASVEVKDDDNNAPIHYAVLYGDLKIVRSLLDHGADINSKSYDGSTPLLVAIWIGKLSIIKSLISKNADLELKNKHDNAPIHVAVLKGELDVIKMLVENGANVNSKGNNGYTPLHVAGWLNDRIVNLMISDEGKEYLVRKHGNGVVYAAEREMLLVIKTLVEHGADVNAQHHLGQTILHSVASFGFGELVEYLLSKNASYQIEDYLCFTPIHWAAIHGHINVIKILIRYGDDVSRKGCNNYTALHLGVMRKDVELLLFLLSVNADPNAVAEDGRTPLDLAFQVGSRNIMELLLKNGAKVEDNSFIGSKVLFGAIAFKSLELVRLLLSKTEHFDTYPTVILNYAIGTQFSEGVKLLLSFGANIEQIDVNGNVPLASGVMSRNSDMVNLILETGLNNLTRERFNNFLDITSEAKVYSFFSNTTSIHKVSALHIASSYGLTDIVGKLVSNGASSEIRDERGYTSLHYACETGDVRVVEWILAGKANKDSVDVNGTTPLQIACRRGILEIVKLLVSYPSAAIDLADNGGFTPLHNAVRNGSMEIVELLLDRGAETGVTTNDLKTPLHFASLGGHKDIVKKLLSVGSDKEAADIEGMTPLHLAVRERHFDIVMLMVQLGSFLDSRNNEGSTSLHIACSAKNRWLKNDHSETVNDIVKIIIEFGGDVDAIDNNQMTPLHVGSRDLVVSCVEALLSSGANVHSTDKWLNAPIHYAASSGNEYAVRQLVKEDADLTMAVNMNRETPLILASKEGRTNVVDFLLLGGLEGLRPDINGRTALHRGASGGYLKTVKLLVEALARKEAEDKWGFTALNYAASWRGHHDVIGYLSRSKLNITLDYYSDVSNPFQ